MPIPVWELALTLTVRCGVLVLGAAAAAADSEQHYSSKAYANDVAAGVRTVKFSSGDAVRAAVFPADVKTGALLERAPGYINLDSGWAHAARGVEQLTARVIALGGRVVCGKTVTGLVREDGRTTCGVRRAARGRVIHARALGGDRVWIVDGVHVPRRLGPAREVPLDWVRIKNAPTLSNVPHRCAKVKPSRQSSLLQPRQPDTRTSPSCWISTPISIYSRYVH
jgi:hypothetical protein